ncbi:ABC transporter, solute-binding protein [Bordetella bronchiseptica MBORD675]|uniref:ABC transporter substrate-binding protein n=1 Tax=Bordetella bronchiseptica TaxID=518 RepID=UPI00028F6961|nr:extracellular solute-binding protein [Bordetella bronchiseptica]AUL16186.1 ABC transporter substrate-binding protein [Bordetella bronchiseptica]AWP59410.1 ABC transporter substrate-binding protein [Bordetella bronchiseptica]KCV56809.1 ABC transporter, solute-binding protein [Bordetella bronchiseptica 7E71]KDC92047.1 ABC transporter, solute-binding protein [Bordetella bronchiseptica MBORD675]CCN05362.1 putative extracellular solute-binding protein [Bordetella bronchiseptica Bbr77]
MNQYSRRDMLRLGVSASAALAASVFLPVRAQDNPLYEAARKEGALNLYWGSYEQKSIEDIRDAFVKKYPGIQVNLLRQGSQTVYTRLRLELQNNAANCDSLGTTNLLHYTELKKINALMAYRPTGAEHLPEAFRGLDPDNTFHVGAISITSINFQSQKVPNPPESWQALLDPAWAGKITVGSPASSGDVAHWALAMRLKYGDDFFKKFAAQKPKVGQSNVDTVTDILAGERVVGAAAPFSYSLTQKAAGQPVDVKVPTDDAILNLGLTAIPAKAPHPNAAKLFTDFLYSTEVSQILARNYWPTLRTDVPWAEGRSLESLKWFRNPTDDLTKQINDTIALWRSTVG